MPKEAVQEVIADLVARDMIADGVSFTFRGLRKNACCCLLERGLNDSEVGEISGLSPETVRHNGKRARRAADRVRAARSWRCRGANSAWARRKA